jgi:UDP-N-acetylmuramate dehydrogenase
MLETLPPSCLHGLLLAEEPMERHTTYRIGGPADLFCQPASLEDLRTALRHARDEDLPYFIMGNGSNLLVSDDGYRGMVIQVSGVFNGIHFSGSQVTVGAGTDLSTLLNVAARRGLFGLPFAVGIPGTVAGAVAMNAGSSTRYMGQHVVAVKALDVDSLQLHRLTPEDLQFQYRRSVVEEGRWVILQVTLQLEEEDPVAIFLRIRELLLRRKEVQPLAYPSAGSVFRNPGQLYAGKLIEEAGCKGWREGDALVSPIHANFIVNRGHASANQVFCLMRRVRQLVQERFGVILESEVRILGDCPEELRQK